MSFDVQNISVIKDGESLVKQASFTLKRGELTVLLGPNGAGKTSLLRAALNLMPPTSGQSLLDGAPITAMSAQARARKIAYLPQIRPLAWPNRVRDIVALGRFAYGANPARLNPKDKAAVDTAMQLCEIAHLSERAADTLSGGELTRLHFARALAGETDYLIADEPVAALDPRHQFQSLDLIRAYVSGKRNGGALVILHDIRLAAQYADRLLWMKGGEIIVHGPPKETLTAQRLAQIYGIKAEIEGVDIKLFGPVIKN